MEGKNRRGIYKIKSFIQKEEEEESDD